MEECEREVGCQIWWKKRLWRHGYTEPQDISLFVRTLPFLVINLASYNDVREDDDRDDDDDHEQKWMESLTQWQQQNNRCYNASHPKLSHITFIFFRVQRALIRLQISLWFR